MDKINWWVLVLHRSGTIRFVCRITVFAMIIMSVADTEGREPLQPQLPADLVGKSSSLHRVDYFPYLSSIQRFLQLQSGSADGQDDATPEDSRRVSRHHT
jgi:hypothetical protein